MPNWKKVITSGSDAALNGLIVTNNLHINASGSSIISGSFVVTGSSQIIGPISVTGNQTIDGNILINGNITAQQYIVSSSVYYVTQSFSSGSTIFGNSLDDTHQFTGSLYVTGSIIGNLTGNASTADSANYAGAAGALTSPANQDLTIEGLFITSYRTSLINTLAQTVHSYTGHVIGGTRDGLVSIGDLVYLETDKTWYQVTQSTDTSTKMLGVWVDNDNSLVLLEGDIVLDQLYIDNVDMGLPVYVYDLARYTCAPTNLTSGYIRAVGHIYNSYDDGLGNVTYILRFKPSTDWTQI